MRRSRLAIFAAIAALALVIPLVAPKYIVYMFNVALIYALVGLGLNLLVGNLRIISIAHGGLFAVGSYVAGYLINTVSLSPWLAIVAATVASVCVGLIVGLPAIRLNSLYLALVTMAFGILAQKLIVVFKSVTGGVDGMMFRSTIMKGDTNWYFFLVVVLVLAMLLTHNLLRSRIGRAFETIKHKETVAAAVGIDIVSYKVLGFAISSAYAGIAGALYGLYTGFIGPDTYGLWLAISFLTMVIVGGLGSVPGSTLGALFVTLVPLLVRGFQGVGTLIYGMSMVITIMVFPGGLGGGLSRLIDLLTGAGERSIDARSLAWEAGQAPQPGANTKKEREVQKQ
ncbi:MAG: branched-chain amino acid ABC transporter permease [Chloroflexota bacterium]|nr:MAG: branched-chain amino acid ABC transporter permease [Chloroflexota bacterium]